MFKKSGRTHGRGSRITALAVAFLFTLTSMTWSTSIPVVSAAVPVPAVPPIEKLSIPAEIGTITRASVFPQEGSDPSKFVVLIQDAHAVVDAQENISKILGHLGKVYGVRLAALEGAKGRLEPILFRTFPEPLVKRNILAGYENRAELSGPEMASVFQEEAADFRGMEDWALYEQNYFAYLRGQEKKEALLKKWSGFKEKLDKERAKIYDEGLNEFQEAQENFLAERSSLLDLLVYLANFKPLFSNGDYKELSGLIDSMGYEKAGKSEALVPMVRKIADEFKVKYLRGLGVKTEMNFYNRYQAFMTGQITAGQMLQYLVQVGREHGKNIKLTPALKKLLGHAELLSEIRGSALYEELQRFLPVVEASLIKTPEQRKMADAYGKLFLLRELIELELTHEALEKYQKEPDAYLDLLGDPQFRKDLVPALEFYQAALERDQAFLGKINAMMTDSKQNNAAVVAGGFHTNGIERLLKDRGVSYAVVTPKIASLAGIENYAKVMKGDISFKDDLKTTYFDALMRHASKALVEALPIPDRARTLKAWRDNLIRELAKQGRITEAGKYLPYIDGILQTMPEMVSAVGPARTKEETLDLVRKELEQFKKDSLQRIWKTFEFQLGVFTDGLKQLVSKKDLTVSSVSALLDQAAQSKPQFVSCPQYLDAGITVLGQSAPVVPDTSGIFATRPQILDELGRIAQGTPLGVAGPTIAATAAQLSKIGRATEAAIQRAEVRTPGSAVTGPAVEGVVDQLAAGADKRAVAAQLANAMNAQLPVVIPEAPKTQDGKVADEVAILEPDKFERFVPSDIRPLEPFKPLIAKPVVSTPVASSPGTTSARPIEIGSASLQGSMSDIVATVERLESDANIYLLPFMYKPGSEMTKQDFLDHVKYADGQIKAQYDGRHAVLRKTTDSAGKETYFVLISEPELEKKYPDSVIGTKPQDPKGVTVGYHATSLARAKGIIQQGMYLLPWRFTFSTDESNLQEEFGPVVLVFNLPNSDVIVKREGDSPGYIGLDLPADGAGVRLPEGLRKQLSDEAKQPLGENVPSDVYQQFSEIQKKDLLLKAEESGLLKLQSRDTLNVAATLEANKRRWEAGSISEKDFQDLSDLLNARPVTTVTQPTSANTVGRSESRAKLEKMLGTMSPFARNERFAGTTIRIYPSQKGEVYEWVVKASDTNVFHFVMRENLAGELVGYYQRFELDRQNGVEKAQGGIHAVEDSKAFGHHQFFAGKRDQSMDLLHFSVRPGRDAKGTYVNIEVESKERGVEVRWNGSIEEVTEKAPEVKKEDVPDDETPTAETVETLEPEESVTNREMFAPEQYTLAGVTRSSRTISVDVPAFRIRNGRIEQNSQYHNPSLEGEEAFSEIVRALEKEVSSLNPQDRAVLAQEANGWILGDDAVSDWITHAVHLLNERDYTKRDLGLRDFIRQYLKDSLRYLRASRQEQAQLVEEFAKHYRYFSRMQLLREKPQSKFSILHGSDLNRFRIAPEGDARSLSPNVMTIEPVVYQFNKGRKFRGEQIPPEKLVFAKWKGRTFLFYTSRTHAVAGVTQHTWRHAEAYFGLRGGWLVKHMGESFPENIDDLPPQIGQLLDEIIYSPEVRTLQSSEAFVKRAEELGLLNFTDWNELATIFTANSMGDLNRAMGKMRGAGIVDKISGIKLNPQFMQARDYMLEQFRNPGRDDETPTQDFEEPETQTWEGPTRSEVREGTSSEQGGVESIESIVQALSKVDPQDLAGVDIKEAAMALQSFRTAMGGNVKVVFQPDRTPENPRPRRIMVSNGEGELISLRSQDLLDMIQNRYVGAEMEIHESVNEDEIPSVKRAEVSEINKELVVFLTTLTRSRFLEMVKNISGDRTLRWEDLGNDIYLDAYMAGSNKHVFKVSLRKDSEAPISFAIATKIGRTDASIAQTEINEMEILSDRSEQVTPRFGGARNTKGRRWYVEEFIEGKTVRQLEKEGKSTDAVRRGVISALLSVAMGLNGKMPRDMHSNNFVVRQSDGRVIMVDIGVNRFNVLDLVENPIQRETQEHHRIASLAVILAQYGYLEGALEQNDFIFDVIMNDANLPAGEGKRWLEGVYRNLAGRDVAEIADFLHNRKWLNHFRGVFESRGYGEYPTEAESKNALSSVAEMLQKSIVAYAQANDLQAGSPSVSLTPGSNVQSARSELRLRDLYGYLMNKVLIPAALAVWLALPSFATAQSDQPYSVRFDPAMGMEAGAESLYSGYRALNEFAIDPVTASIPYFESNPLGRFVKLFGVDRISADFFWVAQHEFFGHGAQSREIGDYGSSYTMNFETPRLEYFNGYRIFGWWSGSASRGDQEYPADESLETIAGGMESTQVMSDWIRWNMFRHGATAQDALLYYVSKLDLTDYIETTPSPGSRSGLIVKGGGNSDVDAYYEEMTAKYGEDADLWSDMERAALWNALDPTIWISAFRQLDYVARGTREFRLPRILPYTGANLTPLGPEYYLGAHFTAAELYYDVYGRKGVGPAGEFYGAGLRVGDIDLGNGYSLGMNLDAWDQERFGFAARTTVSKSLSDRFRISVGADYKTEGYLKGRPSDEGISGYISIQGSLSRPEVRSTSTRSELRLIQSMRAALAAGLIFGMSHFTPIEAGTLTSGKEASSVAREQVFQGLDADELWQVVQRQGLLNGVTRQDLENSIRYSKEQSGAMRDALEWLIGKKILPEGARRAKVLFLSGISVENYQSINSSPDGFAMAFLGPDVVVVDQGAYRGVPANDRTVWLAVKIGHEVMHILLGKNVPVLIQEAKTFRVTYETLVASGKESPEQLADQLRVAKTFEVLAKDPGGAVTEAFSLSPTSADLGRLNYSGIWLDQGMVRVLIYDMKTQREIMFGVNDAGEVFELKLRQEARSEVRKDVNSQERGPGDLTDLRAALMTANEAIQILTANGMKVIGSEREIDERFGALIRVLASAELGQGIDPADLALLGKAPGDPETVAAVRKIVSDLKTKKQSMLDLLFSIMQERSRVKVQESTERLLDAIHARQHLLDQATMEDLSEFPTDTVPFDGKLFFGALRNSKGLVGRIMVRTTLSAEKEVYFDYGNGMSFFRLPPDDAATRSILDKFATYSAKIRPLEGKKTILAGISQEAIKDVLENGSGVSLLRILASARGNFIGSTQDVLKFLPSGVAGSYSADEHGIFVSQGMKIGLAEIIPHESAHGSMAQWLYLDMLERQSPASSIGRGEKIREARQDLQKVREHFSKNHYRLLRWILGKPQYLHHGKALLDVSSTSSASLAGLDGLFDEAFAYTFGVIMAQNPFIREDIGVTAEDVVFFKELGILPADFTYAHERQVASEDRRPLPELVEILPESLALLETQSRTTWESDQEVPQIVVLLKENYLQQDAEGDKLLPADFKTPIFTIAEAERILSAAQTEVDGLVQRSSEMSENGFSFPLDFNKPDAAIPAERAGIRSELRDQSAQDLEIQLTPSLMWAAVSLVTLIFAVFVAIFIPVKSSAGYVPDEAIARRGVVMENLADFSPLGGPTVSVRLSIPSNTPMNFKVDSASIKRAAEASLGETKEMGSPDAVANARYVAKLLETIRNQGLGDISKPSAAAFLLAAIFVDHSEMQNEGDVPQAGELFLKRYLEGRDFNGHSTPFLSMSARYVLNYFMAKGITIEGDVDNLVAELETINQTDFEALSEAEALTAQISRVLDENLSGAELATQIFKYAKGDNPVLREWGGESSLSQGAQALVTQALIDGKLIADDGILSLNPDYVAEAVSRFIDGTQKPPSASDALLALIKRMSQLTTGENQASTKLPMTESGMDYFLFQISVNNSSDAIAGLNGDTGVLAEILRGPANIVRQAIQQAKDRGEVAPDTAEGWIEFARNVLQVASEVPAEMQREDDKAEFRSELRGQLLATLALVALTSMTGFAAQVFEQPYQQKVMNTASPAVLGPPTVVYNSLTSLEDVIHDHFPGERPNSLLREVSESLRASGVQIEVVQDFEQWKRLTKERFAGPSFGGYDPDTDTIYMYSEVMTPGLALHEAYHALVQHKILGRGKKSIKEFSGAFDSLYQKLSDLKTSDSLLAELDKLEEYLRVVYGSEDSNENVILSKPGRISTDDDWAFGLNELLAWLVTLNTYPNWSFTVEGLTPAEEEFFSHHTDTPDRVRKVLNLLLNPEEGAARQEIENFYDSLGLPAPQFRSLELDSSTEGRSEMRVVGQSEIAKRLAAKHPPSSRFSKAPILGFEIMSADWKNIPKAIRDRLGKVDQTYKEGVEKVLEANIGGFIALQMKGDQPDFYIVSPRVAQGKYQKTVIGYEGYDKLVRAMKAGVVEMVRMSDLGYSKDEAISIQVDWGSGPETQTKPAGQDAYLAHDGKQWYMLNVNVEGLPVSYVPVSASGETAGRVDLMIRGLIDVIARRQNLSPEGRRKIQMIAELAKAAHSGQKRKNGDPYFRHPLEMAWYTMTRFNNYDAVLFRTNLLHDTREDQIEFYEAIKAILDDMFAQLEKLGETAATEEDRRDYNLIRLGVRLLTKIVPQEVQEADGIVKWQITHKDVNGKDITRTFNTEAEAEAAGQIQYYTQMLNPHRYFRKEIIPAGTSEEEAARIRARYADYDDAFVRGVQQAKLSDRIVNTRDLMNLFDSQVEQTDAIRKFPTRMIGKTMDWMIPYFVEGENAGKTLHPDDRKMFYEGFVGALVDYANLDTGLNPRVKPLKDAALATLRDSRLQVGIEVAGMRREVDEAIQSRSEMRGLELKENGFAEVTDPAVWQFVRIAATGGLEQFMTGVTYGPSMLKGNLDLWAREHPGGAKDPAFLSLAAGLDAAKAQGLRKIVLYYKPFDNGYLQYHEGLHLAMSKRPVPAGEKSIEGIRLTALENLINSLNVTDPDAMRANFEMQASFYDVREKLAKYIPGTDAGEEIFAWVASVAEYPDFVERLQQLRPSNPLEQELLENYLSGASNSALAMWTPVARLLVAMQDVPAVKSFFRGYYAELLKGTALQVPALNVQKDKLGARSEARTKDAAASVLRVKGDKIPILVRDFIGTQIKPGMNVLEMGVGSGVLTRDLAEGASRLKDVQFFGADINPEAVQMSRSLLGKYRNVRVLESDLFSAFKNGEKFDVVFWNPPWSSQTEVGTLALAKADPGFEVLRRFLKEVPAFLKPGGKVYLIMPVEAMEEVWEDASAKFDVEGKGWEQTENTRIGVFELTSLEDGQVQTSVQIDPAAALSRSSKNEQVRSENRNAQVPELVITQDADWREAFQDKSRPLFVEVGVGDGKKSMEIVKSRPDVNFILIEPETSAFQKLEQTVRREGLTNIRIVRGQDGDLFNLQKGSSFVDLIYCVAPFVNTPWSYFFSEGPQAPAFQRAWDLLKKNGEILIMPDETLAGEWYDHFEGQYANARVLPQSGVFPELTAALERFHQQVLDFKYSDPIVITGRAETRAVSGLLSSVAAKDIVQEVKNRGVDAARSIVEQSGHAELRRIDDAYHAGSTDLMSVLRDAPSMSAAIPVAVAQLSDRLGNSASLFNWPALQTGLENILMPKAMALETVNADVANIVPAQMKLLMDTLANAKGSLTIGLDLATGQDAEIGAAVLEQLLKIIGERSGIVNELAVSGKLPGPARQALKSKGINDRPIRANQSFIPINAQDAVPLVMSSNAANGVIHQVFYPIVGDRGAVTDTLVNDYANLLEVVAAIHCADIISRQPNLLKKPELLKAELLKTLFRQEQGAVENLIQVRAGGRGFTISSAAVKVYLEMMAKQSIEQAA
jgi:methylase of polypeptide subunit release factors